jgi:hypothetical protein
MGLGMGGVFIVANMYCTIIRIRQQTNPWLTKRHAWRHPGYVMGKPAKPSLGRYTVCLLLIAACVAVLILWAPAAHAQDVAALLQDTAVVPPVGVVDPGSNDVLTRISAAILDPLNAGRDQVINNLVLYLSALGTAAATLALAMFYAASLFASDPSMLRAGFGYMIRIGVCLAILASMAMMRQFVIDPFTQLNTELTTAIAGGQPGGPPFGAYDALWNQIAATATKVDESIPDEWKMKILVLHIQVGAFRLLGGCAVVLLWVEAMATQVLFTLLLSITPLGVMAYAFPATRGWANGLISAIVGVITANVMLIALLIIVFTAENTVLTNVIAVENANISAQCKELLIIALVFLGIGGVASQVPAVAAGIAGSVVASVGGGAGALAAGAAGAGAAGRGGMAGLRWAREKAKPENRGSFG